MLPPPPSEGRTLPSRVTGGGAISYDGQPHSRLTHGSSTDERGEQKPSLQERNGHESLDYLFSYEERKLVESRLSGKEGRRPQHLQKQKETIQQGAFLLPLDSPIPFYTYQPISTLRMSLCHPSFSLMTVILTPLITLVDLPTYPCVLLSAFDTRYIEGSRAETPPSYWLKI